MVPKCTTPAPIESSSGRREMSEKVLWRRLRRIRTYELVGCYAWSKDKAGQDVGELVGIDPLGVAATNDVDALLALKPDVVVYNPMWIDVDELTRILAAGVNVVSSASFITGHNLGAGRDRIEDACRRGNSTMFGSGVSPGFADLLAIVAASTCDRVDKVTIERRPQTRRSTTRRPPRFRWASVNRSTIPILQAMTAQGTAVFAEAVRMVADSLGVELDEVVCEAEYAQTTADLDLGSWTIKAGCVAGVAASWKGSVGDRVLVELNVRWRKGQTLEPDWKIDQDGWVITDRRAANGDAQRRISSAARLRGRDDRGIHGARAHHDGDASDQRDPGRRGRSAGYRHVQRPAAGPAPTASCRSGNPGEPTARISI